MTTTAPKTAEELAAMARAVCDEASLHAWEVAAVEHAGHEVLVGRAATVFDVLRALAREMPSPWAEHTVRNWSATERLVTAFGKGLAAFVEAAAAPVKRHKCWQCNDTGRIETRRHFPARMYQPARTLLSDAPCPRCSSKPGAGEPQ